MLTRTLDRMGAGHGAGEWQPAGGGEGAGPYRCRPEGVGGPADAAAT